MTAKLRTQGWPANVVTRRPPRIVWCAELPKQHDADQPRATDATHQQPVKEVA